MRFNQGSFSLPLSLYAARGRFTPETGILMPNNQRQDHISHAPKDVLPLRICANYCASRRRSCELFPDGFDLQLLPGASRQEARARPAPDPPAPEGHGHFMKRRVFTIKQLVSSTNLTDRIRFSSTTFYLRLEGIPPLTGSTLNCGGYYLPFPWKTCSWVLSVSWKRFVGMPASRKFCYGNSTGIPRS